MPGTTPRFESSGRSTVRAFQASRGDPSIRSRGGDARVMLREFGGAAATSARKGNKDAAKLFGREVECMEALKEHAKVMVG